MGVVNRLGAIRDLPTLPVVVNQVLAITGGNDEDAASLAEVVSRDPPLAAQVLRMANSAFYGKSIGKISSVLPAITRIGFNEVRNLALAVGVVGQFGKSGRILDYRRFWQHSLFAARLSREIARNSEKLQHDREAVQRAYLAGLLHDIGILTCERFFAEEFDGILQFALNNEISFLQAERSQPGVDRHGRVGGALLELWKLHPALVASVRFHHNPADAPGLYASSAQCLFLAEYILCNSSVGSFEGQIEGNHRLAGEALGLSPRLWPQMLDKAQWYAEQYESLLTGIEGGSGMGGALRAV